MVSNKSKKCSDCYYWQGSCLCGDSKNYGKFLFVKPCEYWCNHPNELKKEDNGENAVQHESQ